MIDRDVLGARLRAARKAEGLTLKEVEARSGFSATHISELERGRTSPTIGVLLRVADALRVNASVLIDEAQLGTAVTSRGVAGRPPGDDVPVDERDAVVGGISGGRLQARQRFVEPGQVIDVDAGRGEVCGVVHRGRVDIVTEGERASLGPGDAFHLSARSPYRLVGTGDEVVFLVTVHHPSSLL